MQRIRSIVNVKNKTNQGIFQLGIKEKIIPKRKDIVNYINDFFLNILPWLKKSVSKVNHISTNRNQFTLIIAHILEYKLFDLIQYLPNTSSDPATLPLKMVTVAEDLIIVPLHYIIKLSFSTGIFFRNS